MRTRRSVQATPRGWLARRLLVTLALALVLTIAAAGAALAATGHPSNARRVPAAETGVPAAEETANESSPSVVPLVFAGIVILAVAFPTLPRYPRSGYYSRGERW
jgi:hypothetical protein